jgi:hypothetical protein
LNSVPATIRPLGIRAGAPAFARLAASMSSCAFNQIRNRSPSTSNSTSAPEDGRVTTFSHAVIERHTSAPAIA